jgi:hypothetical protein
MQRGGSVMIQRCWFDTDFCRYPRSTVRVLNNDLRCAQIKRSFSYSHPNIHMSSITNPLTWPRIRLVRPHNRFRLSTDRPNKTFIFICSATPQNAQSPFTVLRPLGRLQISHQQPRHLQPFTKLLNAPIGLANLPRPRK